jgi:hypothetical protein
MQTGRECLLVAWAVLLRYGGTAAGDGVHADWHPHPKGLLFADLENSLNWAAEESPCHQATQARGNVLHEHIV